MNEHIVLRAVCTYHRVTPAALLERTKVASIVWLRHELIYLLRSHTNLGWLLIGKFVGGRDQATVKNSVEQVTERILSDQTYAAHVENLSRFVQQFAQASPEPALALARRMIGAEGLGREDAERAGMCLLTAASILGNTDLSDAEARQAALVVLGSLANVA